MEEFDWRVSGTSLVEDWRRPSLHCDGSGGATESSVSHAPVGRQSGKWGRWTISKFAEAHISKFAYFQICGGLHLKFVNFQESKLLEAYASKIPNFPTWNFGNIGHQSLEFFEFGILALRLPVWEPDRPQISVFWDLMVF